MIVSLTNRNQITIPRDIIRQLGYKTGQPFELQFTNNQFVLTPVIQSSNEKINDLNNKTKDCVTQPSISNKFTRKIESNLQEGQKFKVKYYSPCKLVIRTKNSYLKQFCKDCDGYLAKQYNVVCPYKQVHIVSSITKNEAQKNLIQEQSTLTVNKDLKEDVNKQGKQTVELVRDAKLKKCVHCGEVDYIMYKVNNKFVCKYCFKKDFKQFYIKYLKLKEQGGLDNV